MNYEEKLKKIDELTQDIEHLKKEKERYEQEEDIENREEIKRSLMNIQGKNTFELYEYDILQTDSVYRENKPIIEKLANFRLGEEYEKLLDILFREYDFIYKESMHLCIIAKCISVTPRSGSICIEIEDPYGVKILEDLHIDAQVAEKWIGRYLMLNIFVKRDSRFWKVERVRTLNLKL